jgi:hypothetical protein
MMRRPCFRKLVQWHLDQPFPGTICDTCRIFVHAGDDQAVSPEVSVAAQEFQEIGVGVQHDGPASFEQREHGFPRTLLAGRLFYDQPGV